MWPATMVLRLGPQLPDGFTAEPRVHLGAFYEIDVSTYEEDRPRKPTPGPETAPGGVATATWAPPQPTLTVEADLAEQYEYEVLVYDQTRGRQLVAAVEIVSPANKDRAEHRRAFVAKCAALLQKAVCVSIVDVITPRSFNLYTDLLALLDRADPAFSPNPPPTYAVTCRCRRINGVPRLETWAYPLVIGQPLPTLPVWLSEDRSVSLELEASYEETCRAIRIA
jgi:hypothetical protein